MYFDDLEVGMSVDIESVVMDKEKMIAFSREYDDIPLHTDE
jgi:acyl dehydratase